MANIKVIGLKELKRAIKRNPAKVLGEARDFLSRGMAAYKRGIIRNPWRIGGSGGGSPVSGISGGNLRDTHQTKINRLQAIIFPTATYAKFVHGGTVKMESRPWLEYAKRTREGEIQKLYRLMLKNITSDLAK